GDGANLDVAPDTLASDVETANGAGPTFATDRKTSERAATSAPLRGEHSRQFRIGKPKCVAQISLRHRQRAEPVLRSTLVGSHNSSITVRNHVRAAIWGTPDFVAGSLIVSVADEREPQPEPAVAALYRDHPIISDERIREIDA